MKWEYDNEYCKAKVLEGMLKYGIRLDTLRETMKVYGQKVRNGTEGNPSHANCKLQPS